MSKIDRSRFRGKSSEATQEMVESNATQGKFPKYYDCVEGDNIIRMAPPHDGDNPWFEPKKMAWLPVELEKDDVKQVRNKPLFCADVHGNEQQKKIGDPVEVYIDMVTEKLRSTYKSEELKEKEFPIFGGKKNGKYVGGFRPRLEYVAYGWVGSTLYRVSIKQSWTTQLSTLSRDEEESGNEINVLTDPDHGVSTVITYNSKSKKDKYTIKRGLRVKPLTDDQLSDLMDKDPLIDIFREKYNMKTLELVMEGLSRIDEKHDYGVFDTPEYQQFLDDFASVTPNEDNDTSDDDGDTPEESSSSRRPAPTKKKSPKEEKAQAKEGDTPDAKEAPEKKDDEPAEIKMTAAERLQMIRDRAKGNK